jgi:hypothetical protein
MDAADDGFFFEATNPTDEVVVDPSPADPLPPDDAGLAFFFEPPADPGPGLRAAEVSAHEPVAPHEPRENESAEPRQSHERLSIHPASPRMPPKGGDVENEGKTSELAKAVEGLREVERQMRATLTASDRALRALRSSRVYESAGFASFAELEPRMVRSTPVLQALRVAVRGPIPALVGRPSPDRDRGRTAKALATISRTLSRLRALEEQIVRHARRARQMLAAIEQDRGYEECGYTSFEDFLERAMGARPLLSCAVSLVANLPLVEERPTPPRVVEHFDEEPPASTPARAPTWVIPRPVPLAPPEPGPRLSVRATLAEEPVAAAPPPPDPPALEPPGVGEASRKRRAAPSRWSIQLAVTAALSIAAIGVGAQTGRGHTLAAEVPDASVLGQGSGAIHGPAALPPRVEEPAEALPSLESPAAPRAVRPTVAPAKPPTPPRAELRANASPKAPSMEEVMETLRQIRKATGTDALRKAGSSS